MLNRDRDSGESGATSFFWGFPLVLATGASSVLKCCRNLVFRQSGTRRTADHMPSPSAAANGIGLLLRGGRMPLKQDESYGPTSALPAKTRDRARRILRHTGTASPESKTPTVIVEYWFFLFSGGLLLAGGNILWSTVRMERLGCSTNHCQWPKAPGNKLSKS